MSVQVLMMLYGLGVGNASLPTQPNTASQAPLRDGVSAGVHHMRTVQRSGGMVGAQAEVRECYVALTRASTALDIDFCISADMTASIIDESVGSGMGIPRMAFFRPEEVLDRARAAVRSLGGSAQDREAHVWSLYERTQATLLRQINSETNDY